MNGNEIGFLIMGGIAILISAISVIYFTIRDKRENKTAE
jgi:hypothetical protein